MNTIRDWFHLKGRNTFDVDPESDGVFFFGSTQLWDEIKSKIDEVAVSKKVPKMVMDGEYGAGKTHILYHMKHYLEKEAQSQFRVFYVRYAKFANVDDKSYYGDFHFDLMNTITRTEIHRLLKKYKRKVTAKRLEASLAELVGDNDIASAFMAMVDEREPFLSWKWLWGIRLSASEQTKLQIPYSLSKPSQFVTILVSIGKLFEVTGNKKPVILMDEAEKLNTISNRNVIDSFNAAFRMLADPENSYVGFIVAKRSVERAGPAKFWEREDFQSRIGSDSYIAIRRLTEPETKGFILDLFENFIDRDSIQEKYSQQYKQTYPFTEDAIDLVVQKVYGERKGSLPRLIIQKVNAIAARAVLNEKQIITRDFVEANY